MRIIVFFTLLGLLPCRAQSPSSVESFHWSAALDQSLKLLLAQHGFRLAFQPGTAKRLGGPFFSDYGASVSSLQGWNDGDNWFINYVGHPMQGAMSGYIQVQNDPKGKSLEFGNTREYWNSRLKALAWNTAYSTQFELGPLSESSIGNVGQRKGTSGFVDIVMTPTAGFGMMLLEDALDKYVIRKWESETSSIRMRVFYRIALNPCRSFANLLRGKGPWYRDSRPDVRPLSR